MKPNSNWTVMNIFGKCEIKKVPPAILKKAEKYCESRYVLYNSVNSKLKKLRKDYDKILSKAQHTDAAQANVTELSHQLERANLKIETLTNQVTQHKSEAEIYRKENTDIMNERIQLLKKVRQKDSSLKRMLLEIKNLDTRLDVAGCDKCNPTAEMVTKEQSLECKENQNERLNNEIANLTEKLNKTMVELLELRQNNNTSGSDQLEIDLKQKTEELSIANTTVSLLTETNRLLTNQNEEKTRKLQEQVNESNKLVCHNRKEFRHQLERANTEIERLSNQVTQHESEMGAYRKERNNITDERDQLLKSLDQKDASLKRLQLVIKDLETKLAVAVSEKYNAISDLAEMATKEQTLECNEKRLESQNERLNNEIANLTEKLNKTMVELLELRQNNNTSGFDQLEIDLKQKTEELRIANATVSQLTETNRLLTNQSEEKTRKLNEQVNESNKLVDHYRKELDAKIKLAELYKEKSDDCQGQLNKLTVAMKELRRILDETTNRCEVLEARIKDDETQHLVNLNGKDEMNAHMKEELKTKNDLFEKVKTDQVETILENFAPSATAANRFSKGCLSLTEISTRYHNAIDSVDRKEDECIQLRMDLEHVRSELNEKIPEFERQRIEYKKLLTLNEDLNQKINNFVVEQGRCQEELDEVRSKFGCLERENTKLKTSQVDLSRQICYLLNEIQTSKGGMALGQQESTTVGLTNQVIAKKLVTFSNIVEMQENNRQLLQKVRDLSTKVEELEEIQNHINTQCYDAKISRYEKQLKDAEGSQRANEEMLAMCLQQKERFKELYNDAMKDFCKQPAAESMDGIEGDVTVMSSTIISKNVPKDKRASEIEKTLQNKMKELKDLREEYVDYRKKSSANFKLLNDEFEAMQTKVRKSISAYCQLSTQAEFANQQLKIQETDISIYKKRIQTLEERNQMYDKTMRDEALNTLNKLKTIENRCEYLQAECRRLKETNSNLEIEQMELRQQQLRHSILHTNLEMTKASSEPLKYEGCVNNWTQQLTAAKSPAPNIVVSTIPCDDLMRMVETLNAMTDTNIRLRDERDTHLIDVKNLTEKIAELEKKLLMTVDEKNKIQDQLDTLKETNIRLTHEIIAVKGGEVKEMQLSKVFPRVEVTPSQQVLDEASSASGSNSSLLSVISSHHQASPSNTVTTQAGGHKRSRNIDGDSSKGVQESSVSENMSPQNKRTRLGLQTFRDISESTLDMKYQIPTSSPHCQEYIVLVEDSEDEDDDGINKTTAVTSAHDSGTQQIVVVDLVDESEDESPVENKQEKPVARCNGQAEGLVENERNKKNDENVTIKRYEGDDVDDGNGGVSSEVQKSSGIRVEEDHEAEASTQMSADNAQLQS